jgi:hypothetical protein
VRWICKMSIYYDWICCEITCVMWDELCDEFWELVMNLMFCWTWRSGARGGWQELEGNGCQGVFFNTFSLGWYYQPRLKRVGACTGMPPPLPFSLGSSYEPRLKDPFSLDSFTRDFGGFFLLSLVPVGLERPKTSTNRD